jgi:hypothetical protein
MTQPPLAFGPAAGRVETPEERRRREYASPEHIEGRARAMKRATPMTKCARCRLPLGRDLIDRPDLIHYDHTDDRAGYLGLSHELCNKRAGGQAAARVARERAAGVGGYEPVWEW